MYVTCLARVDSLVRLPVGEEPATILLHPVEHLEDAASLQILLLIFTHPLPILYCKETVQSSHNSKVGCPRNNQIFFSVRTETNRNSICFGCFSVCFAKPKNIFFGLFQCFGRVANEPKQTEFSRNKPKQTKKSPKNVLY